MMFCSTFHLIFSYRRTSNQTSCEKKVYQLAAVCSSQYFVIATQLFRYWQLHRDWKLFLLRHVNRIFNAAKAFFLSVRFIDKIILNLFLFFSCEISEHFKLALKPPTNNLQTRCLYSWAENGLPSNTRLASDETINKWIKCDIHSMHLCIVCTHDVYGFGGTWLPVPVVSH